MKLMTNGETMCAICCLVLFGFTLWTSLSYRKFRSSAEATIHRQTTIIETLMRESYARTNYPTKK